MSGRPLSFLRTALAGTEAALSGDHGWELIGIGPRWHHPMLKTRARQARLIAARARRAVAPWRGTSVELKTVSVAVHYRRSRSAFADPLALRRALKPLCRAGWRLDSGKKVWEFRPREAWGKGEAILLAARRLGARVVFAGDDVTDEDAFHRLGARHRTIKVGPGRTLARERILGIGEMNSLLRSLLSDARSQASLNERKSRR